MKKNRYVFILLLTLLIPVLAGCESKKLKEENLKLKQQFDKLNEDNKSILSESDQIKKEIEQLKQQNTSLQVENDKLKKEIVSLKKNPAKKTKKVEPKKKTKKKKIVHPSSDQ